MSYNFTKMGADSLLLANKKTTLRLIKQKMQISRSDITKETGLTPPTISRIVDELVYTDNIFFN